MLAIISNYLLVYSSGLGFSIYANFFRALCGIMFLVSGFLASGAILFSFGYIAYKYLGLMCWGRYNSPLEFPYVRRLIIRELIGE